MKRLLAVAVALLAPCFSAGALAGGSAEPYLGTWTAGLSLEQMYDRGLDPRLAGSFRLVLRKNGTYTTFNSLDRASRGRFVVSGRRVVFSDDVGCAVAGLHGKGVYTWTIARGKLRLATVRKFAGDPCGGRWQTLTYPVWNKR